VKLIKLLPTLLITPIIYLVRRNGDLKAGVKLLAKQNKEYTDAITQYEPIIEMYNKEVTKQIHDKNMEECYKAIDNYKMEEIEYD
jgi:hypothetical protein